MTTERLTTTEVARTLLEARVGGSGGNSIGLTRNAKGVVQIEVNLREAEGAGDLKDAVVALFDALAAKYPYPGQRPDTPFGPGLTPEEAEAAASV